MSNQDNMPGFPGSFANTISGAQGGPSFGVLGGNAMADTLPTHPKAKDKGNETPVEWSVHYRQFDLNDKDDVSDLQEIMSSIANNQQVKRLRHERFASGHDGHTLVTLSWAVATEVEREPPEERVDEEGKPYKLQQQYPYPTIEDGGHPGAGDTLEPPGASNVKEDPEEDDD